MDRQHQSAASIYNTWIGSISLQHQPAASVCNTHQGTISLQRQSATHAKAISACSICLHHIKAASVCTISLQHKSAASACNTLEEMPFTGHCKHKQSRGCLTGFVSSSTAALPGCPSREVVLLHGRCKNKQGDCPLMNACPPHSSSLLFYLQTKHEAYKVTQTTWCQRSGRVPLV